MEPNQIVACICEGNAEHAVMDILLENNALIFHELLDDKIIRARSAESFQSRYLNKVFNTKITIFRILDSRNEKFKLNKRYCDKVDVINVITAPEIELLIILSENKYDDFIKQNNKSKQLKPSEYCTKNLNINDVKSYQFFKDYFQDMDRLIDAIKKYKSYKKLRVGERSLYDIIKPEFLK